MPRATPSIYVTDKDHWDNPEKAASREETIIKTYRKHFGYQIPPDRQYWTMCSHQVGDKSELSHLCSSGLITQSQFRGVDIEPSIIRSNKEIYPDVWWRCGHFVNVMEAAAINGDFRPAIVNYDGVQQIKGGCDFLKSIFLQIDGHVHGSMLLVANFLLNNPYCRSNEETKIIEVIERLRDKYFFPDHWALEPEYYWYPGTGEHSNSQMGILMFVKSPHTEIAYTASRRII